MLRVNALHDAMRRIAPQGDGRNWKRFTVTRRREGRRNKAMDRDGIEN